MNAKILLIPAAALLLAACGKKKDTPAATPTVDEVAEVQIATVAERDIDLTETYTANIEADNLNNIAPATPNRIREIKVDVGDRVSRGQVVARLDGANVEQLKIQLDQAERNLKRAQELLNIGSGTRMAVEQAQTALDAARSQYNLARENTILTSPISGVVTARNYDPGDMSGGQPILTVGQITPKVKAMVQVSEQDLNRVKTGMPAELKFDTEGDAPVTGTVSRIYPTVDPATRTFGVEISVPNPNGKIKPGQFAYVTLSYGQQRNVVVTDRAIVKQPGSGNRYVYVYDSASGTVSYNQVELGRRIDDSYEIISGVSNGDAVVVAGQQRLRHGAKAKVVK